MKTFVAVLGRQPLISVAELESLYEKVRIVAPSLAEFELGSEADLVPIARLGGTLKIAELIDEPMVKFWERLPESGKIVLGVSDFSKRTNPYLAQKEALRWKRILGKAGRNVRVVPNKTAVLSSATSWHNRLFTDTHIELLKNGNRYYRVVMVQDIDAYAKRDQARPARDAKVGMLPPKLAQILINLCGRQPAGARLLDPFCGTGVVLQEGVLMGYVPYGTDKSERMVEYSERNLKWLIGQHAGTSDSVSLSESNPLRGRDSDPAQPENSPTPPACRHDIEPRFATGDATSYQWEGPIDLVACETYLGAPMSQAPAEIKLREAKQECKSIIVGFLRNLSEQVEPGTPVVIAVPAWLRPDKHYERLNLLDEIDELRYNVVRFKNLGQKDLLYHREGQVVAREIIVLRKK